MSDSLFDMRHNLLCEIDELVLAAADGEAFDHDSYLRLYAELESLVPPSSNTGVLNTLGGS